jgi:hypothetical protein
MTNYSVLKPHPDEQPDEQPLSEEVPIPKEQTKGGVTFESLEEVWEAQLNSRCYSSGI